jgi:Spy/CpxP family protein refolding chaperone
MANVRPQVRQELDATNAEIETVLTPEQKTKFSNLRMRIGARWRDRGSPRQ